MVARVEVKRKRLLVTKVQVVCCGKKYYLVDG